MRMGNGSIRMRAAHRGWSVSAHKSQRCVRAHVRVSVWREGENRMSGGELIFIFPGWQFLGSFLFYHIRIFFFLGNKHVLVLCSEKKKKPYKYIQIKFFSKGFHQFLKETRLNFQLTPQSADIGSTLPPRTEGDGRCVRTGSGVTPVWPKAQC